MVARAAVDRRRGAVRSGELFACHEARTLDPCKEIPLMMNSITRGDASSIRYLEQAVVLASIAALSVSCAVSTEPTGEDTGVAGEAVQNANGLDPAALDPVATDPSALDPALLGLHALVPASMDPSVLS